MVQHYHNPQKGLLNHASIKKVCYMQWPHHLCNIDNGYLYGKLVITWEQINTKLNLFNVHHHHVVKGKKKCYDHYFFSFFWSSHPLQATQEEGSQIKWLLNFIIFKIKSKPIRKSFNELFIYMKKNLTIFFSKIKIKWNM